MILYTDLKEHKKRTVIIPESKLHLLTEALTDIVYHYTSLKNGYKITSTDTIHLQSALGGSADNMNRKELYYLSTTREKNSNFGYSYKFKNSGVRIELDGQKLSQRFKGQAIDYWGDNYGKQTYYDGRRGDDFETKQHHTSSEAEDRLFSNQPTINNVHKYIRRIDVIFNPQDEEELKYVYHILNSNMRNITYVYDDINDFNAQNDKIINRQLIDNVDYFTKYYDSPPSEKNVNNTNYIGKILKFMLNGEVEEKDKGREIAKLLKQYGLEKYLNGKMIELADNTLPFGGYKTLIGDVSNIIADLSSKPTEEGQKIVKMFSDYFKKNGFKRYSDAYKHKIGLGMGTEYDSDEITDKEKEIKFLTYKGDSFLDVIIPEPDKTSFWLFMPDRKEFTENLYYYAVNQYNEDEQDKIKHKSRNNELFLKYIKELFQKNVSVSKMLDIVKNLGISDEDKKALFNFGTFQYENLKFFQAKYYRLPQFINSNDFFRGKDGIENANIIRRYYFK